MSGEQQDSGEQGFSAADRRRVAGGVAITILGGVGALANAAFLFVGRGLFGGDAFGLFVLAFVLIDLISRFLVSGFTDAIAYFASRHVARNDEPALYRSLATAMAWPLAGGLVLAMAIFALAPTLFAFAWPDKSPALIGVLRIVCLNLPLAVLVRLPVHAIKAHLNVKWAVFIPETVLPLTNVVLIVVFSALDMGTVGLAWAWVGAHLAVLPLALYGYSRHFDVRKTLRALPYVLRQREVLAFALPHSLSMGFYWGLAKTDALILSFWVDANIVGVYTLVGEAMRAIRVARTSVVGIFAPLVARYQAVKNQGGIQDALDRLSRWTSLGGLPLVFAILAFYPEFIGQTVGDPATYPWLISPLVAWFLATESLLNCFWGLSGSVLLMTGHIRVLLLNTSLTMALHIGLNLLLIPRIGPVGAAAGTLIAGGLNQYLQVFEMRVFEHIHLRFSAVAKPIVASLVPLALVLHANSPGVDWQAPAKIALTVAACLLYALIVLAWPGHNPERLWLRARLNARPATPGA